MASLPALAAAAMPVAQAGILSGAGPTSAVSARTLFNSTRRSAHAFIANKSSSGVSGCASSNFAAASRANSTGSTWGIVGSLTSVIRLTFHVPSDARFMSALPVLPTKSAASFTVANVRSSVVGAFAAA